MLRWGKRRVQSYYAVWGPNTLWSPPGRPFAKPFCSIDTGVNAIFFYAGRIGKTSWKTWYQSWTSRLLLMPLPEIWVGPWCRLPMISFHQYDQHQHCHCQSKIKVVIVIINLWAELWFQLLPEGSTTVVYGGLSGSLVIGFLLLLCIFSIFLVCLWYTFCISFVFVDLGDHYHDTKQHNIGEWPR